MAKDLGQVVSTHRGRLRPSGVLAALVMTVGCLYAGAKLGLDLPGRAYLVAAFFGLVTLVLGIVEWRTLKLVVTAYERGIGWTRGGEPTLLAFDEIASVSVWRMNGRAAAIILRLQVGGEHRFTAHVSDPDALQSHLQRRPLASVVPRAIARTAR